MRNGQAELFKNQGHGKEIKQIEWRPRQFQFKKYLDDPTCRRNIWVVRRSGNEGKYFFKDQI